MIERRLGNRIFESVANTPVICVTGPRQSGKTTLVKHLFPEYKYYNLEFPDHRQFAQEDANGFLKDIENGIVIDEIQRVPELLSTIQYLVDETRLLGKIVITGSQNLLLMQSVSQTLAGRVALYTLLPFSLAELTGTIYEEKDFESYMIKSFYPGIYDRTPKVQDWLQDYINTYIERDVRQITAVKDLSQFNSFLQLCAGHIGQVVNYSTFSNNLGIDVKTVKSWMSILETSYIIYLQHPYYKNFNKRIIKAPRLYFYDVGLACNLLGIRTKIDISTHYLKGGLFESFIVSELIKYIFNNKMGLNIYYFRDSHGNEMDVLIEMEGMLKAIEIKSGKTINTEFFKTFKYFKKLFGDEKLKKFLVYGGEEIQNRSLAKVLGWKNLEEIFQ